MKNFYIEYYDRKKDTVITKEYNSAYHFTNLLLKIAPRVDNIIEVVINGEEIIINNSAELSSLIKRYL